MEAERRAEYFSHSNECLHSQIQELDHALALKIEANEALIE
jgi:hypothetical protein